MKICTICNQTYTDDNLNFCLSDGGLLTKSNDDPPPTVIMNQARRTNELNLDNQTNWTNQPPGPMSPWQNPQFQQNQNYMPPQMYQSQNMVVPIISMVLGILSMTMCCYGFPFGIAAAITGFIGMNNANNNPTVYGGRGFAIAGLILGIVDLLITLVFLLIFIVGSISK
jgi:hypothetical protein